MKKTFLILTSLLLMLSFSSCRISKSIVMLKAKSNSKLTEERFIIGKQSDVLFLKLSSEQKGKCEKIWKEEKDGLARINTDINSEVAPVVYKSEMEFRNVLTSDQLTEYKREYISKIPQFFLNDKQLSEIKRIYIDKM